MVGFKSWNDFKQFMLEYVERSCFNCIGYHDSDKEFNGRFICWKTLSPVRMDLTKICAEWQDNEGHTLDKYPDIWEIKFSEEIAEKLDNIEEILSFEEIKEFIENEHKEIIE